MDMKMENLQRQDYCPGGKQSVRLVSMPGNGTRYEALGVLLTIPEYENHWLIAFPNIGVSHIFSRGSYVAFSYMREKMGFDRNGLGVSEVDLREMARLVAIITGGTS